jgi:hypothetical protein
MAPCDGARSPNITFFTEHSSERVHSLMLCACSCSSTVPTDQQQAVDHGQSLMLCAWCACRIKILQLVATGAAAFPLLMHLRGDAVALDEVIGSVMLTSCAGLASFALWFYGQRYIGELSIMHVQSTDQFGHAYGAYASPPFHSVAHREQRKGHPQGLENDSGAKSGDIRSTLHHMAHNRNGSGRMPLVVPSSVQEQVSAPTGCSTHQADAEVLPERGTQSQAHLPPSGPAHHTSHPCTRQGGLWVCLSTLDFWGHRQVCPDPGV